MMKKEIHIRQDNRYGNNIVYINPSTIIDIENLKQKLIKTYTTKYQTINLIDEREQIAIEDIFVNIAIIKDESQKEKNKENENDEDKLKNRDDYLASYENIYKPKESIEIKELIEKSRIGNSTKSVILGKPGVGKTTLCHYIAYHWANGKLYQEYDLVIYIPLRRWRGSLAETIQNIYLKNKSEIDIRKLPNNTLFIFDGYDELVNKNDFIDEINNDYLLNYIITTRPYNYAKGELAVNAEFETIGYTEENIEEYIDKFFKDDKEKAEKLKEYINENINIKQIAYIPIMLTIVCLLYRDEELQDGSLTLTDLYTEMIDKFLTEYHEKTRKDKQVYDSLNHEAIKKILGKIAFYGLIEQKIIFDKSFIDSIAILTLEEKIFLKDIGVHAGFIKTENRSKDLYNNKFEFIHLTFQEYFAGYYVNTLSTKEEISQIIKEYKFYPHMQMFFVFLAGLIEDKEFLIEEIQNEPKDIVGFYELLLILDVLSQLYNNKINIDLVKAINKNLLNWIHFAQKSHVYNIEILVSLQKCSWILNSLLIRIFIESIKNNDIDIKIRIHISKIIGNIKNNLYIFEIINIIKNKIVINDEIIKELVKYNIENKKILSILNYRIKKGNLHPSIISFVIKRLLYTKSEREFYILIKYLYKKNFYYKEYIAVNLFLFKNNDNFISVLFDLVKDDRLSCLLRSYLITNIFTLNNNQDYFEILINLIYNRNVCLLVKLAIAENLYTLDKRDNGFIDKLINLIQDTNIDINIKKLLAKNLAILEKNDNSIIEILENYTDNIQILLFLWNIKNNHSTTNKLIETIKDSFYAENIIIDLYNLNRNDDEFLKLLIELIHNQDISYSCKKKIAENLYILERKDNKFVNLLIALIENINIDLDIREQIAISLLKIERNDNLLIERIFNFIEKNINETFEICSKLYYLNRSDDYFIEKLLKLLEKNEWLDKYIFFSLSQISRYDEKIFKILLNYLIDYSSFYLDRKLNYWENDFFYKEVIKNIYYFFYHDPNLIKYLNKIKSNSLKNEIINNIPIKSILIAYDKFLITYEDISCIILNNINPFFIENNKLCTIYEGEKICTHRDFEMNIPLYLIKKVIKIFNYRKF